MGAKRGRTVKITGPQAAIIHAAFEKSAFKREELALRANTTRQTIWRIIKPPWAETSKPRSFSEGVLYDVLRHLKFPIDWEVFAEKNAETPSSRAKRAFRRIERSAPSPAYTLGIVEQLEKWAEQVEASHSSLEGVPVSLYPPLFEVDTDDK